MKKLFFITLALFLILSLSSSIALYLHYKNKVNKIPVVYIIDDSYSIPLSASINSMLKNKNKNTVYEIYIIGIELPEKYISALENLANDIDSVKVIRKKRKEDFKDFEWLSTTPLYKFDIPDIFSEKQKIIYIDADTLILKDLTDLYNTNIENKYAAVVKDAVTNLMGNNENLQKNDKNIFSSAVMLLNLEKIRKDNLKSAFLKFNTENKRHFLDLAFSEIFGENVIFLSPSYNFEIVQNTIYPLKLVSDFYDISLNEYLNILLKPHIIHFVGYTKPWRATAFTANYKLWESYLPKNKNIFLPNQN